MYCDEVEETVLHHEALSYTTFVPNHLSYTLSNLSTSYFCYIAFVLVLDEADKPHLQHTNERLVYVLEAFARQVLF